MSPGINSSELLKQNLTVSQMLFVISCIETGGTLCVIHQVAALFCVIWRHGRRLESV